MDKRTIVFVILMTAVFYTVNYFFFPPAKHSPAQIEQVVTAPTPSKPPEGRLYVLENDYQQLVISTLGGAVAEINLPFKSKENTKSVVRKIRFDNILSTDYPQNDSFPSAGYETSQGSFPHGTAGGYYPLLRRGISPKYFGMTLGDEMATYSLERLEKNLIVMEGKTENGRITKTYRLPDDPEASPYTFSLTVQIQGNGQGLGLGTGVPEVEIMSGSSSEALKYLVTKGREQVTEQLSLPKGEVMISSVQPDWIADSNGFFAILLDPQEEVGSGMVAAKIPGHDAPTRLSLIDAPNTPYPAEKYPGYEMRLPLKKGSGTYEFKVFAGPLAKSVLAKNGYTAAKSYHGWFSFISGPFAKFLFLLMQGFYAIIPSWGLAIILLTIALRIMMYPLNAWSIKSTIKMQKLAPKLAQLQEKYKKDPKRAQVEIMGMYKEQGVNPLGGCLPLLIQMPFLIGMFDLLKSAFELRGATFIPGWITNLAAPDILFSWHTPIWFFGTSFHLLPFLLGAAMYWQQKMSAAKTKNAAQLTDQQRQQKMMGNIMTVLFTVLFYHFPSGLNLYWLSSMLLGILQQWWMSKKPL
jgi:YidC/Oxa1 family membrane protein insertase